MAATQPVTTFTSISGFKLGLVPLQEPHCKMKTDIRPIIPAANGTRKIDASFLTLAYWLIQKKMQTCNAGRSTNHNCRYKWEFYKRSSMCNTSSSDDGSAAGRPCNPSKLMLSGRNPGGAPAKTRRSANTNLTAWSLWRRNRLSGWFDPDKLSPFMHSFIQRQTWFQAGGNS